MIEIKMSVPLREDYNGDGLLTRYEFKYRHALFMASQNRYAKQL